MFHTLAITVTFKDAFTHWQRPLQPLLQLLRISSWHTSEAWDNVIHWTSKPFSLFFHSFQTRIRELLVCNQWLTPAVTYLVQCSFQVLHEGIWRRFNILKQPAFPCKDIFSIIVNWWYCAGAIVYQYCKLFYRFCVIGYIF